MTHPANPSADRPQNDRQRRRQLGLDVAVFAAAAGITIAELRDYEATRPEHVFSDNVAKRVGEALDLLEHSPSNSVAAREKRLWSLMRLSNRDRTPDDFDRWVRDTAHFFWEIDGRPTGRDRYYWQQAHQACRRVSHQRR